MDLHQFVRGAITANNPDQQGTVFVSTGFTTVRGIAQPQFKYVIADLQVQPEKHDPLTRERGASYNTSYLNIYAYGRFGDLSRPDGTGGDVIAVGCKWYYITQVLEWWPDWCAFQVTEQLTAGAITTLLDYLRATGVDFSILPGLPTVGTTQWTF